MSVRILIGDVRARLRMMPEESVHCVVTSPPYWGLRDYGVDGQIGMEPTLPEHLAVMVDVFREVRRVLRKDGSLWLNYGDCYASTPNGRSAADTKAAGTDDRTFRDKPFSTIGGVLKPKDLCMIPNRLAIALQEDGWWVRKEIVWGKPNAMPDSSGRFRPATSFEKIFLLSKSGSMFYDAAAVKMPPAEASLVRWNQNVDAQEGSSRAILKKNGNMKAVGGPRSVDKQRGHSRRHAGFNDRWDKMTREEQQANGRLLRDYEPDLSPIVHPDVWAIATAAFKEAHFATFPPALVVPCVMAGTSEKGVCSKCGAPWVREIAHEFEPQEDVSHERAIHGADGQKPMDDSSNWSGYARGTTTHATLGWHPSCACEDAAAVPATVLDPFGGAGTLGLVADRLQRDAVMIELNPQYAAMAVKRIEGEGGMFARVEIDPVPTARAAE